MTQFSAHADLLQTAYSMADWYCGLATNAIDAAAVHWGANQDHNAIEDLILGAGYTKLAVEYMLDEYSAFDPYYRLCKIHKLAWEYTNWSMPEYKLTPEKICEAWAKDDFAGRMITVAFIDRMRQILWNEPYRVLWAARPETG